MSTTKKAASKPAVQAEAEGDAVTVVKWRGEEFTVAADADDWPVELLVAFEDGKVAAAVRGALGPSQWSAFMRTRPRTRDLAELYDVIATALGLDDSGN